MLHPYAGTAIYNGTWSLDIRTDRFRLAAGLDAITNTLVRTMTLGGTFGALFSVPMGQDFQITDRLTVTGGGQYVQQGGTFYAPETIAVSGASSRVACQAFAYAGDGPKFIDVSGLADFLVEGDFAPAYPTTVTLDNASFTVFGAAAVSNGSVVGLSNSASFGAISLEIGHGGQGGQGEVYVSGGSSLGVTLYTHVHGAGSEMVLDGGTGGMTVSHGSTVAVDSGGRIETGSLGVGLASTAALNVDPFGRLEADFTTIGYSGGQGTLSLLGPGATASLGQVALAQYEGVGAASSSRTAARPRPTAWP